jgi:iron complex outermembrane receptor protein
MKIWLFLAASLLPLGANATIDNSIDDNGMEESEEESFDFYGDDDFVSIATGTKIQIHKAPAVATVITAKEIEKMGAISVFDALESVVGLHIYPSNFNRMNSNISIRGIHTGQNPQILVLVNGVKTTSMYVGAKWDIFNVGLELIDRIEVIRGPGSAVYGADAFSGVINIITKGVNSPTALDMGVKAGSFDTKSSWINYVNSDDELKLSFNAQWFKTDGDKDRIVQTDLMHTYGLGFLSNAPGPLDTKKEMYDIHAQLEYSGFYLAAWGLKNDGGTGAGAAQALSNSDLDVTKAISLSSGYKWQINPQLNADFKLYRQTYDEEVHFVIFPPGMALPRAFDENGAPTAFTVFTEGLIGEPTPHNTNSGANIIVNYTGLDNHNIRAELGYRNSDEKYDEYKNFGPGVLDGTEDFVDGTLTNVRGTPYIYMTDQQRTLRFLSIQDEWQLGADWGLTAGGRYDEFSDFGSTFNPRVALVWQTNHNLTTKFLYGAAFRAPSFAELHVKNNPVALGNENIQPETIKTYEIAWDYRPSQEWQFVASVFSYNAQQLIVSVAQNDGTSVAQNAGHQDGYGAELEVHWKPNDSLDIELGYAWQNSRDTDTNETIADAPGQMLDANVNWKIAENVNLHMDTRWIMDRKRLATDTRDEIEDYNWTNLSLIYDLSDQVNLRLSIRNLFDSNAREASDGKVAEDYPLEGRGIWLSVNYSM